jgi:small subunit ribosomal protein S2
MKKFIFGSRSGIYIIDLEKTEQCINAARDFLMDITSKGEFVLFVGTKKQAQDVVKQKRCAADVLCYRPLAGGYAYKFATIKRALTA